MVGQQRSVAPPGAGSKKAGREWECVGLHGTAVWKGPCAGRVKGFRCGNMRRASCRLTSMAIGS